MGPSQTRSLRTADRKVRHAIRTGSAQGSTQHRIRNHGSAWIGVPQSVDPAYRAETRVGPIALAGTRSEATQGADSRLHPRLQATRSEEHTSELQSLMRISYAFFYLK